MKINKMPEFCMIFARKILFLEFWGQFPALKPRVSGLNPNTNYVIMGNIVLRLTDTIMLNIYCLCASLRYFTALAQMHTPVSHRNLAT